MPDGKALARATKPAATNAHRRTTLDTGTINCPYSPVLTDRSSPCFRSGPGIARHREGIGARWLAGAGLPAEKIRPIAGFCAPPAPRTRLVLDSPAVPDHLRCAGRAGQPDGGFGGG